MFELRWLERSVPVLGRETCLMQEGVRLPALACTEIVLQYRAQENCASGMTGEPFMRWSEWRDVPTVTEQEAASV